MAIDDCEPEELDLWCLRAKCEISTLDKRKKELENAIIELEKIDWVQAYNQINNKLFILDELWKSQNEDYIELKKMISKVFNLAIILFIANILFIYIMK